MVRGAHEHALLTTTVEDFVKLKLNFLLTKLVRGYDYKRYIDVLNHYEAKLMKASISEKILDLVSYLCIYQ